MGCSGCHGKGSEEGVPTWGHILGCGSIRFPDKGRWNPFAKDEQEKLLTAAVTRSLRALPAACREAMTGDRLNRFVKTFARNLQVVLHDHTQGEEGQRKRR